MRWQTERGSQMGFPLSIGEENSFHDNRQERETIQKLSLENGKTYKTIFTSKGSFVQIKRLSHLPGNRFDELRAIQLITDLMEGTEKK